MTILSSHSARTAHSPTEVFQLWADPLTWPLWDPDVKEVRFDGGLSVGAQGWMRPTSGPATSFIITELESGRLLANRSRLPGATLTFGHVVEPAPGGSAISVEVRIDGPLAAVWRLLLARTFTDTASTNVSGLIAHLDSR